MVTAATVVMSTTVRKPTTVQLHAQELHRKNVEMPGQTACTLYVRKANMEMIAHRPVAMTVRAKDAAIPRVNASNKITIKVAMLDVIRNDPVAMATMKPVVCLTISPSLMEQ